MVISADNAEHYRWGEDNDGWRLLAGSDLSVIEERVPPGGAEQLHFHRAARHLFDVLAGNGTMIYIDREVRLGPGQGLEIPPGVLHQFVNHSNTDVRFLVISAPSTREDRVNFSEKSQRRTLCAAQTSSSSFSCASPSPCRCSSLPRSRAPRS